MRRKTDAGLRSRRNEAAHCISEPVFGQSCSICRKKSAHPVCPSSGFAHERHPARLMHMLAVLIAFLLSQLILGCQTLLTLSASNHAFQEFNADDPSEPHAAVDFHDRDRFPEPLFQ